VSAFLTDLDTRLVCEFDNTESLLAPLEYYSDLLERKLVVPTGFVTDFASVPRVLGAYLLFGGKGRRASALHDMLYTSRIVDRETADLVLREALLATGYSRFTAQAFYLGVRAGGQSHWDKDSVPQPLHVDAALEADALMLRAGG
jgi:hypothetical protein